MIQFLNFLRRKSMRRSLSMTAHAYMEPLETRCMLAQVSGTIASDTVWSLADSPYVITGNVTVASQATLTIEPGVVVQARPSVGIQVNGRLVAEGTPTERIRFERSAAGKWSGIALTNTLADNRIAYADMSSGDSGGQIIDVDHSRLLVDHVTWSGTTGTVIEVLHPSLIVRNSQLPVSTNGNEVIHGEHITGDEYLIIEGNVFANSDNGADVIDFLGANRPGPVLEVRNNIFLGGGDDGLDLDGTDAYIEGNIFMNFHKNTTRATTSNAIATGLPQDGENIRTEITVVRNIFINNDHALLLKEDAFATLQNNVILNSRIAAIQFNEVGGTAVQGVGKGADLIGNIFDGNKLLFKNLIDQPTFKTHLTVNQNLIPNDVVNFGGTSVNAHDLGTGNIAGDPMFVDAATGDYRLQAGSPALGAGPWGLDIGALVPSGAVVIPRGPVSEAGNVTVDVGGPGVANYRYRLDGGTLSELRSVAEPIALQDLDPAQSHTLQVVAMNDAGEWFTAQSASWQARTVQVMTPRRTRTGDVLPIVARGVDWQGAIDTTWSPIVALNNPALSDTDAVFWKGVASLAPTVSATSHFDVNISGTTVGVGVLPNDFPTQVFSGTLSGDTIWSADTEYHVTGDLTIPAGSSLTIQPGTRVLLGDRVNLFVDGALNADGIADDPILFSALDVSKPWGGIEFRNAAPSHLRSIFLTHGGADTSRAFGHSNSQPLLRVMGAELSCDNLYLIDNVGKGFGTTDARINVSNSVLDNLDTGGEFRTSVVLVDHSWIMNIGGPGTAFIDDDNDGFYFNGVHASGEASRFQDSFVINTKDDGLDQNGAKLDVVRAWTQNTFHEGIATSSSQTVNVTDSVFTRSNQGVEAGYGSPNLSVSQSVIVANQNKIDPDSPITAGLRFGDGYSGENGSYTGHITAQFLVIHDNGDNVRNYDGEVKAAKPGAIDITRSVANDADATDPTNLNGAPIFSELMYLLRSSVGFSSGPEGMPMGREIPAVTLVLGSPGVSPGDFNADGAIDGTDIGLICAAIQINSTDANYDLDGDGSVTLADHTDLILNRLHTTFGDANLDGVFNSTDLVQIFAAGKYENGVAARDAAWAEGDWNCDGKFDTKDLVVAFQAGGYQV